MKRYSLTALVLALVVLGACKPDAGAGSTTTAPAQTTTLPETTAPATSTTAPETTTTTTAPPELELSGVSLGFNNAEQGVIAPDGTPLLVVMRLDAVEVVRGGAELVRAGGSGRVATAAIAAGETRVVVAWAQSSVDGTVIKAAVSEDSGRSFGPEQELGGGAGPSLAASGDETLAVWHTGPEGVPGGDVVMARLPAGAGTWEPAEVVDESPAAPLWASVDAQGSTVVVSWRDDRDGAYSVWTRTSTDLGFEWQPEVHAVTTVSGDPDVCLDPAGTVWLGYHGRGGVYLTRSTNGGASYVPPARVGDGWFAHVACDSDEVAVAWEETTSPPKAPEASKAAGWATYTSLMEPITRGSEGAPNAAGATVVPVAGGGLELVWVAAEDALTGTLHRLPLPD